MSRRQDALQEVLDRLQGISIAGGFQTDVGQVVFIGERPKLGPDDPQAFLSVVVEGDEPGYQGENVSITLPVAIHAIVAEKLETPATVNQSWATVEAIIADVKKAMEIDHDLAGLLINRGLERGPVEPRDREPGDEVVGASVRYSLRFTEQWGAP